MLVIGLLGLIGRRGRLVIVAHVVSVAHLGSYLATLCRATWGRDCLSKGGLTLVADASSHTSVRGWPDTCSYLTCQARPGRT
ncbi:hypothetical protein PHLGIDRAFT_193218 [Phlebiopsis gigantea 11061_1 CR5-6]|uniref:Uncharacterized protein n=1 Tax=Phlebiopsis gigantea (strain 11061_1 CR5-6) TaxID=745531 RepID=A0A0C3S733_PHLG1|nr:hypothetical protein PHLGIDRAFT_193218 [Phlebiopsis gigantea 11061_1 CR5-6]